MAGIEVLLMPQVFSVSFITITRCLDDVEVTNDDQLITIEEDGEATNIYIRGDICTSDQPSVNFELLQHFSSLFKIDAKHANLVNLLMSAPIPKLSEIMEQHDLLLPEDSVNENAVDDDRDNEPNAMTMVCRTATQSVTNRSFEPTQHSRGGGRVTDLERRFGNLELSSEADDHDAAFEASSSSPNLLSLHELIPSHQERIERVSQRASHFRVSDSFVAEAPIRSLRPEGISHQSLPTPTGDNHSGGEGLHEDFTERHTTVFSRSYLRSHEPPPPLSQAPRGSNDGDEAMKNIRYREIGFLGELFVTYPRCLPTCDLPTNMFCRYIR